MDVNPHVRKKSKLRRSREECFDDLPVGDEEIIIPDEVHAEPGQYKEIGEVRSFEVRVNPPEFFKKLIILKKFKRIDDASRPPIIAPAPQRIISGSYASVDLVTYIIIGKYLHHNPLYRQEMMYKAYGVELSRKRMADWIGQVAVNWLKPIYNAMLKELRACNYLQLDETLTRYINGKIRKGKSEQGYFWVISRPGGDAVFLWSTNRRHQNVNDMLGDDYKGIIQTDGYQAYQSYANTRKAVTQVGCWAHLRRYFTEAEQNKPTASRLLIRLINILFAYEKDYQRRGFLKPEIERRRQSDVAMTIALIKRMLEHYRQKYGILPDSKFGKAIKYGINQWPQLVEYLKHGEVFVSNNLVENAIRPIALGRKNWLFVGHEDAGERSAIIYSILASCKRQGIDPAAYLRDTLNEMLHAKSVDNKDFYANLTPGAYAYKRTKLVA